MFSLSVLTAMLNLIWWSCHCNYYLDMVLSHYKLLNPWTRHHISFHLIEELVNYIHVFVIAFLVCNSLCKCSTRSILPSFRRLNFLLATFFFANEKVNDAHQTYFRKYLPKSHLRQCIQAVQILNPKRDHHLKKPFCLARWSIASIHLFSHYSLYFLL